MCGALLLVSTFHFKWLHHVSVLLYPNYSISDALWSYLQKRSSKISPVFCHCWVISIKHHTFLINSVYNGIMIIFNAFKMENLLVFDTVGTNKHHLIYLYLSLYMYLQSIFLLENAQSYLSQCHHQNTITKSAPFPHSRSDVAILYNDRSVLENHHVSAAYRLMQEEEMNILANLNKDDWR